MSTKLARPYVLTPDKQKEIIQFLSEGNWLNVSLEAADVSYDCFRHWQRRWEEDDPVAQQFADFFKGVKRAVALGEVATLRMVSRGDPGWQSSAWKLERRFPKRWAKKEAPANNTTINVKEMSDEQLDAIAKGKGGSRT